MIDRLIEQVCAARKSEQSRKIMQAIPATKASASEQEHIDAIDAAQRRASKAADVLARAHGEIANHVNALNAKKDETDDRGQGSPIASQGKGVKAGETADEPKTILDVIRARKRSSFPVPNSADISKRLEPDSEHPDGTIMAVIRAHKPLP